jgi:hypothetical protein
MPIDTVRSLGSAMAGLLALVVLLFPAAPGHDRARTGQAANGIFIVVVQHFDRHADGQPCEDHGVLPRLMCCMLGLCSTASADILRTILTPGLLLAGQASYAGSVPGFAKGLLVPPMLPPPRGMV